LSFWSAPLREVSVIVWQSLEITPQRRNEPPTAGNISEAGSDMLLADLPLQVLRGSDEITDRCREKVDVQTLQTLQALQRFPGLRMQD
jgi:hypothetical protein